MTSMMLNFFEIDWFLHDFMLQTLSSISTDFLLIAVIQMLFHLEFHQVPISKEFKQYAQLNWMGKKSWEIIRLEKLAIYR